MHPWWWGCPLPSTKTQWVRCVGANINPAVVWGVSFFAYDSWFTIGSEDSNGTSDVQQVGMDTYFATFETVGFVIDTFIGGSWFLIPGAKAPMPWPEEDNRVLVGSVHHRRCREHDLELSNGTTRPLKRSMPKATAWCSQKCPTPGCTSCNRGQLTIRWRTRDDGSCVFAGTVHRLELRACRGRSAGH